MAGMMEQEEVMDLLKKPRSEVSFRELVELVHYLNRPTEIPLCRVCGEKLLASGMGGGHPTVYHCSSEEADFLKDGGGGFGSESYKHYAESEFEDSRHADPWAHELAQRVLIEFFGFTAKELNGWIDAANEPIKGENA